MNEQELVNQITRLEILSMVYAEQWGANCQECKDLDKKIHDLNTKLLDYLVGEAG